ncbi:Imm26 family immunity protein [Xanthomonas oryzae]|uniref:Imm26 family immunity protein n=1 Tax=Xanthomonas oryzae TaxID=347 RepID=UPI000949C82C|nr:Imm26 family immunity protein [Xanthomonas oryzae]AXQ10024.1 hypothetical protein BCR61_16405 [Xanthomonas oryzae pv. oryzae]AXQ75952.1 hypothetical protein BXU03_16090 [Xanthomonas oryzae pv. oryzae]AZK88197.1 hypothetical protein BO993_15825 [Xanthomonas oryzae pv. oryzae]OLG31527.1 hypothetical protein BXO2_18235 [Xanthomonas oryzae pv. oryzae]OLG39936.1 hypothetical protein BXO33_20280 [Xanthomonas oryzae pv. oryzae]
MTDFLNYVWSKKKRTVLRSLKQGDFFCFFLSEGKYGFGRLIAKLSMGHSVEIFDIALNDPVVPGNWSKLSVDFYEVVDSYSLFDKKSEGDWRVVGYAELEVKQDYRCVFFGYGSKGDRNKVNLLGEKFSCDEEEYIKLPPYRPAGNKSILARMQ